MDSLRWYGPAALVKDRRIFSDERVLRKDYDGKCSVENNNAGRESQGACHQDEPQVVK
jgi:hypothetical protein